MQEKRRTLNKKQTKAVKAEEESILSDSSLRDWFNGNVRLKNQYILDIMFQSKYERWVFVYLMNLHH